MEDEDVPLGDVDEITKDILGDLDETEEVYTEIGEEKTPLAEKPSGNGGIPTGLWIGGGISLLLLLLLILLLIARKMAKEAAKKEEEKAEEKENENKDKKTK